VSAPPTLDRLLGAEPAAGVPPIALSGLSLDSRSLRPGEAFVALRGASQHGLRHAQQALDAGAVAVLFEPPAPADCAPPEGAIAVPGLRARLGEIADRCYGSPSRALVLVGVTGTNGKTSTVQLLAQAFALEGHRAGSIGTLGAGLVGQLQPGERTTPDVIAVHRLLAELRDAGASHVAMEVSSHALDQGRVDAVSFDVGVFTNLTRDHLDYHGSMQAYGEAKARLFARGLEAAVINRDDAFGRELLRRHAGSLRCIGLSAAGDPEADLYAANLDFGPHGLAFDLVHGARRASIESPLLGRFNVDNLLAVAGVLLALGRDFDTVAALLPRLAPVAGRMNRLGGEGAMPLVVVDYAHTPDALVQALASLRPHTPGRLICVFGCGGERDRGKRPQMAAAAEAGADRVIVTDDNPRGEDGDAIVVEILSGFATPEAVGIERDRARAIGLAIAGAGAGDTVLVAGKGHEPYQEIGGRRLPFDDLAQARAALEARA
jgi:UDP-N-acetylmuramoyl-L-alanyl-D-glutamate--2,6-diaminopimelate ligase